jgi:hypothetical protein
MLSGLTMRQREHEGVVAVRNASALLVHVMTATGLADSVQILEGSADGLTRRRPPAGL